MQLWTLPPSFIGHFFCLSSYCPPPIRLHTIPVGIMVHMFWGGGSHTHVLCPTSGQLRKLPSIPKGYQSLSTPYGRPACTQVWEVHAITVDPVGINANNTGRYFLCTPGRGFLTETRSGLFVTIFHNTDRDYSCAYKINPTGTILVRENSTDRVSFVSFPPHFPPSARGRHPLSTHHQLQGCTGYTLLHSTFPELALFRILACIQHEIPVGFLLILTGIIFHCFFTPTGVINTPILM